MALSDREKKVILDSLDVMDDVTRTIVLASLEAFAEWLSQALYSIFLKVKEGLFRLWNWMCSQF